MRYSYEIAGGILIVLSSVVSEQMPKEWRLRMWTGFIALALMYMGFGIHLAKQAEFEQSRRDTAIQDLQRKLDQSVLEQARMTGQLTAVREIMGNLSQTGLPGFKEFAVALSNLARNNVQRAADAKATDKQLCDRAESLVSKIRIFQNEFEKQENEKERNQYLRQGKTREEQQALFSQQFKDRLQREDDHLAQFRSLFVVDAKSIKDLMMDRLEPEQRDFLVSNNHQADFNLDQGTMNGAANEYMFANYLEQIAKTLCPEKNPGH